MVKLISEGVYLQNGEVVLDTEALETLKTQGKDISKETALQNTIACQILKAHNTSGSEEDLQIKFDALASHDITYVGIIQTARASGMTEFPLPYVLTNCHNSLCAVGGTINEDDHHYGLAAAKKYGGIYVPAHLAVIHQYMREEMAACGRMILGSDSHTRYGALGTMGIGEGGPELVKQLMKRTYDVARPDVVAVYLEGAPKRGVGPQDVALSIIGAVFKTGFVKNKVLEFVGPGIENLTIDFRNGIDVMTTETTCLSSIWCTDDTVKAFYEMVDRPEAYKKLQPEGVAYYDGMIKVDLSAVEPMIALPFHPSNVYTIAEVKENAQTIFKEIEEDFKKTNPHLDFDLGLMSKITPKGIRVDQGIIAGCAGGLYENIHKATDILSSGQGQPGFFNMSVYPASEAVHYELLKNGVAGKLLESGITMKTAFCGPCFGAGDVPAHQNFSIRHTTRNFPNREGSKPSEGQIASVALMDALSIAATAANGGILTSATELEYTESNAEYAYKPTINKKRVYNGYGQPDSSVELVFGPNITDWPEMRALSENVILEFASVIHDEVTTTDELIPSGDTSSYRSNPIKLSEFTLSRKDPQYVGRAKTVQALENERRQVLAEGVDASEVLVGLMKKAYGNDMGDIQTALENTSIGSLIFARKPGDGSAREQAASCQRVLGGMGNIALEYATKRYRSNVINWGMIPFTVDSIPEYEVGDLLVIKGVRQAVLEGKTEVEAQLIQENGQKAITLKIENLGDKDREIILDGCLMNYYAKQK